MLTEYTAKGSNQKYLSRTHNFCYELPTKRDSNEESNERRIDRKSAEIDRTDGNWIVTFVPLSFTAYREHSFGHKTTDVACNSNGTKPPTSGDSNLIYLMYEESDSMTGKQ